MPFSFNPKAGNHSFFFDSQAVVEELGMCVFFVAHSSLVAAAVCCCISSVT